MRGFSTPRESPPREPPNPEDTLPRRRVVSGNALTFHSPSLAWQLHWTPGEAGLQGIETIKRMILLTETFQSLRHAGSVASISCASSGSIFLRFSSLMTEWRRVSFLIASLDLRAWHARNTPSGERAAHDGHGHRGCSSATLRRPRVPALPKAHPQALSSAGREHWGALIMRVRSPYDAGTPGPAGNGSSATNSSLFRPHPCQGQASKTSHSLPDLSSGQSSSRHGH